MRWGRTGKVQLPIEGGGLTLVVWKHSRAAAEVDCAVGDWSCSCWQVVSGMIFCTEELPGEGLPMDFSVPCFVKIVLLWELGFQLCSVTLVGLILHVNQAVLNVQWLFCLIRMHFCHCSVGKLSPFSRSTLLAALLLAGFGSPAPWCWGVLGLC